MRSTTACQTRPHRASFECQTRASPGCPRAHLLDARARFSLTPARASPMGKDTGVRGKDRGGETDGGGTGWRTEGERQRVQDTGGETEGECHRGRDRGGRRLGERQKGKDRGGDAEGGGHREGPQRAKATTHHQHSLHLPASFAHHAPPGSPPLVRPPSPPHTTSIPPTCPPPFPPTHHQHSPHLPASFPPTFPPPSPQPATPRSPHRPTSVQPTYIPLSPLPPPCFPTPSSLLPPSLETEGGGTGGRTENERDRGGRTKRERQRGKDTGGVTDGEQHRGGDRRGMMEGEDKRGRGTEGEGQRSILLCHTCFHPPSPLLPLSRLPASPLPPPCFPSPSSLLPPSIPNASPMHLLSLDLAIFPVPPHVPLQSLPLYLSSPSPCTIAKRRGDARATGGQRSRLVCNVSDHSPSLADLFGLHSHPEGGGGTQVQLGGSAADLGTRTHSKSACCIDELIKSGLNAEMCASFSLPIPLRACRPAGAGERRPGAERPGNLLH
ncbi:unnamed protein product [Closterium sp. Naga37s-1]|nr:unnamed protein product [Closterium sp. Naga37s-1]